MEPFGEETKLSDGLKVLRVKKYSKLNFEKEKIPEKPPADLFNLSSTDKSEGEKRNRQPLLSVWESSIPKDHVFENVAIKKSDLPAAYELSVEEIHKIQVKAGMVPISVHTDPLKEVQSGDLHAGIEGLCSMPNIPKAEYKNIKDELVKLSTLIY